MGYEPYVATVVVIEQNHWPTEWAHMIWMEKKSKPPQLIEFEKGETAFFFDRFEQLIQVTIIEQGTPVST